MRRMASVALIAITWLLVTTVANIRQAVAAPGPTRTVFDLTDKNTDNRVDREEFHQRRIDDDASDVDRAKRASRGYRPRYA